MNMAKRLLCSAAIGMLMAVGAGGMGSTVAQAVPITPLADVAPDVAASNPALAQQLKNWQALYNRTLATLAPLPVGKAVYQVLHNASFTDNLQKTEAFTALEQTLAPLLERWQTAVFEQKQLDPADSNLLALLKAYGLTARNAEGTGYLALDAQFALQRIQDAAMPAFLAVFTQQPAVLFEDAGCKYELPEMGAFAVAWERYLQANPQSPLYSTARRQYMQLLEFLMFSTYDNTPAFPKGTMRREWVDDLQKIIAAHPQTVTSAVLTQFLTGTKAANYAFSKTVQRDVMQRIAQSFPMR